MHFPGIGIRGLFLQRMFVSKAITDIGGSTFEIGVLIDKIPVDGVILNDVVGNKISDCQVTLRGKYDAIISQFERAMIISRHHVNSYVWVAQTVVGQAGPQNRVHLGHIGAPQNEGIRVFKIVVAAHGLVDTEAAHESAHSRRHTMARVGIEIIGTEPGFHQFRCRIPLHHCPLPRTEHTDAGRSFLLQRGLPLLGHHIKRGIP